MDENRGIGKNGTIPWKVSEDFAWFKSMTLNKTIVVGRKTFDTLPNLKNRSCYIITNNSPMSYVGLYPLKTNIDGFEGMEIRVDNLKRTVDLFAEHTHEWIVCGGAKTYELLMPYITEFYVTHVKGIYDSDTFMSPFEHLFIRNEVVKEFGEHKVIKYIK